MLDDHHNNRGGGDNDDGDDDVTEVREIHALTSPHPSSLPLARGGRSISSSLSIASSDAENFTTMSREFSAMVVAGSNMQTDQSSTAASAGTVDVAAAANLGRIGEEEMLVEETNPLAIVPDSNPIASPRRAAAVSSLAPSGSDNSSSFAHHSAGMEAMSVHRVKKEEVESKIAAWQTAEIAKINNRFKREDVVINGWESEQVEKASAWLKRVERKLDEQRARALEKMQNDVAKARRKAEEKRASAEAKRGTKVAKVFELSNLLRAVGRAPSKRSFF